jgi:hypothetical protein
VTCPILVSIGDENLLPLALATRARLIASRWSQYMAARYNGPVYLVGSVLAKADPRDIDLRVVVADKEFEGRYGLQSYAHFPNQAWLDDMAKRNGELARDFRINCGFQVHPASYVIGQFEKAPRLLVDAPSDLAHIVASVAWWYDPPPAPGETVT